MLRCQGASVDLLLVLLHRCTKKQKSRSMSRSSVLQQLASFSCKIRIIQEKTEE